MAAILSSAGEPSGMGGRSGRTTQTPTRSSRRSPLYVEGFQRADDPVLEGGDKGADILAPALQVEHHIGDPLAGAVVGVFAASAGFKDRESDPDRSDLRSCALVPAV